MKDVLFSCTSGFWPVIAITATFLLVLAIAWALRLRDRLRGAEEAADCATDEVRRLERILDRSEPFQFRPFMSQVGPTESERDRIIHRAHSRAGRAA